MNENKQPKGSHITLEQPISSEDLHNKLFNAVMLPQYEYKSGDTIYLYMSSKKELNRRIIFINAEMLDKTGRVLIGKYEYCNFWSPPDAALAFAQTITDRVIKLSGAT
ncbi:hypothetical protein [Sulfurimonas sp.]|uniref:hypothetical protein n=1 Tax=Sulfurimonas sp. TaxID=2022749 RepID=UPI002611FC0A|nr:hypothetical protein [Sulfurimonas sp.]MDD3856378.1 hypothetical protein [Sulfurimonas sp.]